ncbi:hypothetical protein BO221_09205 [Archangium sp. Cb G35]|nr:hypothetical protein BO221_09205 [Archangium sp. Cb G35]
MTRYLNGAIFLLLVFFHLLKIAIFVFPGNFALYLEFTLIPEHTHAQNLGAERDTGSEFNDLFASKYAPDVRVFFFDFGLSFWGKKQVNRLIATAPCLFLQAHNTLTDVRIRHARFIAAASAFATDFYGPIS